MEISRVIIKKFRSIKKADIWVDSINAIVGQNNSGKSCLLRALNVFFNYEKEESAFVDGVHSFAPRAISKVEIHFENFDENRTPDKYINNNKVMIEAAFQLNAKGCKRTIKYKSGNNWVTDSECIEEIKKQIEFILIPPNRDAKALELMEHSVLQLLVEEKMKEATSARDNYTVKFRHAINHLETNALDKIARDAKAEFPVNKPFDIKIKYSKTISYKDFLSDVSISIEESGLSHPLVECGSGIQSLTIISLYNLLGKARDENIIIGLEEPETNLHPQAQKELIRYFKGLVEKENILQLFFTTHSSQMIDQVDHTEIISFKKELCENRGFITTVNKLPKDFFDKYDLDDFKYYQFHRYRNSDFFFSSHVIVTESKNEVEIIKRIGDAAGFDFETNGLSYLNLEGVDKAKYTIHLLNELEIPFLIILDKDFFVSYLNDDYASSLNTQGFPQYKTEYKDEELIKVLIPNENDRNDVLSKINTNHTAVLNTLEKHNVISMRYSLDLDLVAVRTAQEKYYDLLRLPQDKRNVQELTGMRKGIKRIDRIVSAFESLETSSWPYSYSRIRKMMTKITRELA
ncbi:ATP-dependent nuclease [Pseudoalteromonas rubra]|uniref:DNA helicase n=1 Tax=Pseudoalteromonas rubra TaxID=43658 RepID=A0A5S3WQD8_9GAMM|nr:AAA family ATPase [Pseudoalteromonas rubra]TMP31199.1 DNA helicase [Pseudoalteromonas rubra]